MDQNVVTKYGEVTLLNVKPASGFYPFMVDLAQHKHELTYGELIAKAKELHHGDVLVQNAVPIGIGRRIEVIKHFTEQHDYPDLTNWLSAKGQARSAMAFQGTLPLIC